MHMIRMHIKNLNESIKNVSTKTWVEFHFKNQVFSCLAMQSSIFVWLHAAVFCMWPHAAVLCVHTYSCILCDLMKLYYVCYLLKLYYMCDLTQLCFVHDLMNLCNMYKLHVAQRSTQTDKIVLCEGKGYAKKEQDTLPHNS